MAGTEGRRRWRWIAEMTRGAARAFLARLRRSRSSGDAPAPSPAPVHRLSPPVPVPADPAEHARQFAAEWADRFEVYARRRMREVGVPEHLIGAFRCELSRVLGGVRRDGDR